MNRNTLRKIHAAAGAGAFLFIASFWSSTVCSELFGSYEIVATVKQTIVYALFGLITCMATTGATGMKMGAKANTPRLPPNAAVCLLSPPTEC